MLLGGPSGLPRAVASPLRPECTVGPEASSVAADPSPRRRKRQVRRARRGQPSTCRRRPGGPAAPRPPRSLLQPDFLFAASRPRLTSRAGKPPKAASFSETPPPLGSASCIPESRPGPGNPRGAAVAGSPCGPRARGRGRPGSAARHQRALRGRRAPHGWGRQPPDPRGSARFWGAVTGEGAGPGHGGAVGETTSARAGAHRPVPDAIREALAACGRWGNLPRRCITPARFATEMEPNQSASALGRGQAAQLPTQRAARSTRQENPNLIGQKGLRPTSITAAAGSGGRGLPARGFKERLGGAAQLERPSGARPGVRVRRSFRARAGDQSRRPPGPVPVPGTMKQESLNTPPASPSASQPAPQTSSETAQRLRDHDDPPALWIFGYGSLVWRPDFSYSDSRVGFVRGYSRRFWQGDTFHRGSDKMPGRVVTLLEDHEGCTWGVAYQVRGEQVSEALKYLNVREAVLGGYDTKEVTFYPQDTPDQPLKALAYVATPQNPAYLGPAPEEAIATQILACRGFAGHNLEYLLRLADFMQLCGPQAQDEHLAAIVDAVGTMLPCFCPTEQALALV
ncbi:Glutathione-specific gamma-glutamylcyclotransferase 1 [Galemys pyrenaicus]|nr:Glutathione-specific gamma-glutamylcyclotransferase 1 [Galemys pyrenaicus]